MVKKLNNIVIASLFLLIGFNFLPQFKIYGVPIPQILVMIFLVLSSNLKVDYKVFLFAIGVIVVFLFNDLLFNVNQISKQLIVLIYLIFPFYLDTYYKTRQIDKNKYLKYILISITLITLLGWLIRLNYKYSTIIFKDLLESEYLLGYWGIRYKGSTRNADFLYPLIGASISLALIKKQNKILLNILFTFFVFTIFLSKSRAALIIGFFLLYVYIRSTKKNIVFKILLIFIIFYLIFKLSYLFKIDLRKIFLSIFENSDIYSSYSNRSREEVFKIAILGFLKNPFGYGLNNYANIYLKYNNIRVSNSAENALLTVLIENGLLVSIIYIKLIINSLKKVTDKNLLVYPLFLYFLFNYELNNIFGNFCIFLAMNLGDENGPEIS